MDCSVPNTSGTFGTCSQVLNANDFNKDSVFWYIEKEDTVYNFNLTLFPFLSSTPIKLIYPKVDAYNLKTLDRVRSFPQFFEDDPQLLPSLMPFSFGSTPVEINIQKTDEPVISFDKINNIFDLSFIGRLPKGLEGVCIFNYRFKKSGQILNPYSINAYTPKYDTWGTAFGSGYLSPNIDLQTYPKSIGSNLFPLSVAGKDYPCAYRPPCEDITAVHALQRDTLKFNCCCVDTLSTFGNNVTFLNYISSFDPSEQIVVTFDLASYYYVEQDYLCTNHSDIICNTRTVSTYGPTDAGEGFCLYFHTLSSHQDFIGSGPGTCLGYAPASAVNVDQYGGLLMNFKQGLYGAHLGLGFDIGGNFHTTAEGKTGEGSASPNSITLRSSINEDHALLYTKNLSASGLTLAQPITADGDIQFNTYKFVLDSTGRRLRAYVLDCTTDDFLELLCYEVNFSNACDLDPNILTPGLSFSTGQKAVNFELRSLNIQGKYKIPSSNICIPEHVPTPTPTCPEAYVLPSPTPTITPTITITPSLTPTLTYTPTLTPTNTPTETVTYTPTLTPTLTPSVTPTSGAEPSPTPTNTPTQTVTPTPTPTNTITVTPTQTVTPTVTPSLPETVTPTPSNTPPKSLTPTPTNTNTPTPTPSTSQGNLGPGDGFYYIKIGITNNLYECGLPYATATQFQSTDNLGNKASNPISAELMLSYQADSVEYTDTKYFILVRVNQEFMDQDDPGNSAEVAAWDSIATELQANILTFNANGNRQINGDYIYTLEEYEELGYPCGDEPIIPLPIAPFDEEIKTQCCFVDPNDQNWIAPVSYAALNNAARSQFLAGDHIGTWDDPFVYIQSPS